jgi:hypothetical protein
MVNVLLDIVKAPLTTGSCSQEWVNVYIYIRQTYAYYEVHAHDVVHYEHSTLYTTASSHYAFENFLPCLCSLAPYLGISFVCLLKL